ncbi:hypothetical protein [Rhodosalinus sp.]|uniref:hypothetical protein n=1 Tax=Rhodosalinus sp. TaxID=2047741 RepID=UPI00397B942E
MRDEAIEEQTCRPAPAGPGAPFARLVVAESAFEIAETGVEGRLVFRPAASDDPWERLDAGRDAGWRAIGAEILERTRDALLDFVRMHLIRLDGEPESDGPFEYDLFGFRWGYRDISPAGIELRLPGRDWTPANLDEAEPPLEGRERAIDALLRAHPEVALIFAEEVHAWAIRLAAGAQVRPAL